jgi:hypothetical protein
MWSFKVKKRTVVAKKFNAVWVDGEGEWALVSCPWGSGSAVTLWRTQTEAENAKKLLTVCGSGCNGTHIVTYVP